MVRLVNKHSGVVVVVDETTAANLSSEWVAAEAEPEVESNSEPDSEPKSARKTTAKK